MLWRAKQTAGASLRSASLSLTSDFAFRPSAGEPCWTGVDAVHSAGVAVNKFQLVPSLLVPNDDFRVGSATNHFELVNIDASNGSFVPLGCEQPFLGLNVPAHNCGVHASGVNPCVVKKNDGDDTRVALWLTNVSPDLIARKNELKLAGVNIVNVYVLCGG